MKKYSAALGCIVLMMVYASTFPMQQPAVQTVGSRLMVPLKKFISQSCTVAHWGISYGPFFVEGIGRLLSYNYDKEILDVVSKPRRIADYSKNGEKTVHPQYQVACPNADPAVLKFVQETGKKITSKEISSVRIHMELRKVRSDSCNFDYRAFQTVRTAAAMNRVMFISPDFESDLADAIRDKNQQKLDKYSGIFEHEWNHIKYYDVLIAGIANLSIPLLNHRLIKLGKKALPLAQKTKPFLSEQCAKISSGWGKYCLNDLSLKILSRYKERRADNGVSDDIQTLEGIKSYFVEEQEREVIHNTKNPSFRGIIKKNLPRLAVLLSTHPSFEQRIARLDQRIDILKKPF